jgi:uncharacterized SAM-binding protein YcdF (DUF218 family)
MRKGFGLRARMAAPLFGRGRHSWMTRFRTVGAFFLAAIALASFLYGGALLFAETVLTTRTPPKKADLIVVLGGDGPRRASHAASLWRKGLAPSVLVVGQGDCRFIRHRLIEDGVAPDVVKIECASASTWQNAEFAQPLVTAMGARSAILVTSWFHSSRALDRFQKVMPEIDWISLPTMRTQSLLKTAFDTDGPYIFKEYIKTVAYDLRSGIGGLLGDAGLTSYLGGLKR